MPTQPEAPKPAPGPEIKLSDLPNTRGGASHNTPSALLDAINSEAAKNGGEAAKLAEPPFNPPAPKETPPAQPQREIQPKETPKPPAEPAQKKKEGIESVREALERAEKRAKEASDSATTTAKERADAYQKVADLEAKLSKAEQDIEKDYKPRMARLEAVEKEVQRTHEILKIKAYQETPEFHDKFVKPLADARAEVGDLLGEVLVIEGDNRRPATAQDFDEILAAKSINEAAELATEKFGPMVSQQIVNYRQKIRSLERSRQEAVKNAALNAEEYEKRTQQQNAENHKAMRDRILNEANRLIEGTAPNDDDEKAALNEGLKHADLLLNGAQNISHDEMLTQIGKGRAAIIKFPVIEKRLAKVLTENAELKEKLKAYESSEPELRGRSGGNAPARNGSSDDLKAQMLAAANAAAVAR